MNSYIFSKKLQETEKAYLLKFDLSIYKDFTAVLDNSPHRSDINYWFSLYSSVEYLNHHNVDISYNHSRERDKYNEKINYYDGFLNKGFEVWVPKSISEIHKNRLIIPHWCNPHSSKLKLNVFEEFYVHNSYFNEEHFSARFFPFRKLFVDNSYRALDKYTAPRVYGFEINSILKNEYEISKKDKYIIEGLADHVFEKSGSYKDDNYYQPNRKGIKVERGEDNSGQEAGDMREQCSWETSAMPEPF